MRAIAIGIALLLVGCSTSAASVCDKLKSEKQATHCDVAAAPDGIVGADVVAVTWMEPGSATIYHFDSDEHFSEAMSAIRTKNVFTNDRKRVAIYLSSDVTTEKRDAVTKILLNL